MTILVLFLAIVSVVMLIYALYADAVLRDTATISLLRSQGYTLGIRRRGPWYYTAPVA